MKKKVIYFIRAFLSLFILLILSSELIYSQGTDPSQWESFVRGENNIVVQDTFRMQTFNEDPTDNWAYTLSGGAVLFDATLEGIKNASEGLSVKLPPGSQLKMESYPFETAYENTYIYFPFAARKIMKGENMVFNADRFEDAPLVKSNFIVPKKEFSVDYLAKRSDNNLPARAVIGNNPVNITIDINTSSSTKNGFYAIDKICAYASIPAFTLFTGEGNWSEKSAWSHLPAARHRKALIQGAVTVDQSHTSCHALLIGQGSLHIPAGHSLRVNNLALCDSEIAIHSSGTLVIQEKITAYKTFPEKGKWYFISFPFDVYTEDIETSFQLGDDSTEEEGNFFYIRQYNGDRRATSGSATGNWEVVSIQSVNENGNLLFEKGKGYLIALDEKADKKELSFSCEAENIPVDFGKKTSIPISVETGSIDDEHQGWFLCGNPLPAPLHLSELIDNPALDGNVYCYDGSHYTAYPIGGDQVLPPFSAFFVKSCEHTELEIQPSGHLRSAPFPAFLSMEAPFFEPEITVLSSASPIQNSPEIDIDGKQLYLKGLPSSGKISIIDFSGRTVYSQVVSAGSSKIPLYLRTGTYILRIEGNHQSTQHKFVWTE